MPFRGSSRDSGKKDRPVPHRNPSRISDAIESPRQEQERLQSAESLVGINTAPEETDVEDSATATDRGKPWMIRPSLMLQKSSNKDIKKGEGELLDRRSSRLADAIESPVQQAERIEDAESLLSVQQPPAEAEVEGRPPSPHTELAKVYTPLAFPVITSLIPGSIFGVLARLGLLSLTSYDGPSIFPLAWVQGLGCLVMGFSLGLKDHIGAYYGPLYTAIATGFCGSLTTFSSWQFDVFIAWANTGHAHRDWLRDVIDGLGQTIFTLAISLSSVTLGLHLSRMVSGHISHVQRASVLTRYAFRTVSVLMYAATIVVYFETSHSFRHQATAAILFSFPGTLTRYILAIKLTPLLSLFPLGTFVANVGGTTLLGIFHVLQRTPTLPSPNGCAILQGLMDGYCGCLTTVSTFAVEVGALNTRRAWLYVFLSWIVSQLLLLVVLGTAWWGANIDDSRMCAYN